MTVVVVWPEGELDYTVNKILGHYQVLEFLL